MMRAESSILELVESPDWVAIAAPIGNCRSHSSCFRTDRSRLPAASLSQVCTWRVHAERVHYVVRSVQHVMICINITMNMFISSWNILYTIYDESFTYAQLQWSCETLPLLSSDSRSTLDVELLLPQPPWQDAPSCSRQRPSRPLSAAQPAWILLKDLQAGVASYCIFLRYVQRIGIYLGHCLS